MINTANIVDSISRLNGGLFESVRRLCQSLNKKGVQVDVLSCHDQYSDNDIEAWLPLRPKLFDRLPPKKFSFAPGLLAYLSKNNFDLIHCHGIWMYFSVANLINSKRKKTPYLISPHGSLDPWAINNSRWKKAIASILYEKKHLQNASCLRALCRSEAESMRAYGLTNPICIIPNGIDLVEQKTFITPSWIGTTFEGKNVLLYLGRIHPKKGLSNLLQAWANLVPTHKQKWVLVIAGWDQGGHEAQLKKMAGDLLIDQEVYFPGPLYGEQKASAYHHADAFILPSFSEGLPMVILEAWAHHLPVVMTPQCNLPEGFEAKAALEVLPDVDSITRGLENMFSMNKTELTKMGENGYALVVKSFCWQKIAADLLKVYKWMLGLDKKPNDLMFE